MQRVAVCIELFTLRNLEGSGTSYVYFLPPLLFVLTSFSISCGLLSWLVFLIFPLYIHSPFHAFFLFSPPPFLFLHCFPFPSSSFLLCFMLLSFSLTPSPGSPYKQGCIYFFKRPQKLLCKVK